MAGPAQEQGAYRTSDAVIYHRQPPKADAARSQSRPGNMSDKPKITAEDFKV